MHLTRYTDYAMRVLLYLGRQPENLCSIAEISGAYAISQNHLMKVVSDLVSAGYLESVRGRHGGVLVMPHRVGLRFDQHAGRGACCLSRGAQWLYASRCPGAST